MKTLLFGSGHSNFLLGATKRVESVVILKKRIEETHDDGESLTSNDVPEWIKASDRHLRGWLVPHLERNIAQEALEKLLEDLADIDLQKQRWVHLQTLVREGNIDKLVETFADMQYDWRLIIMLIRNGLERRSKKKWQVRGSYSAISIRPLARSKKNSQQWREDVAELAILLKLPGLEKDGVSIPNSHWQHNYYKEFLYRAWGVEPKVLGYWDQYD